MYGFALHDFGSRRGGHRARKQFQSWAGGWTLGLCSLQESLLTHRAWEKLTPARTTHSSALTEKDHRSDQVMRTKPSRDTVKTLDNYVLPVLPAGWSSVLDWGQLQGGRAVLCCRKTQKGCSGGKVPHSLDKQCGGSVITVKTLQEGGSSSGTGLLLLLPPFYSLCCSHGAADQAFVPHASPCYSVLLAVLRGTQAKNLNSLVAMVSSVPISVSLLCKMLWLTV